MNVKKLSSTRARSLLVQYVHSLQYLSRRKGNKGGGFQSAQLSHSQGRRPGKQVRLWAGGEVLADHFASAKFE